MELGMWMGGGGVWNEVEGGGVGEGEVCVEGR